MDQTKIQLREKALRTIHANLVQTKQGEFLAAGGHQFRTLWVRDFCFAVPGLLAAGKAELVERQLRLIYSFQNSEGFFPRGIDETNPKWRVLWSTALRGFPNPYRKDYTSNLRPEFFGEHATPAFDSNLLFLLAWLQLHKVREAFPIHVSETLQPYEQIKRGVLLQPPFSDWQDSARRSGSMLFTHLLLWQVLEALKESAMLPERWAGEEVPLRTFLLSHKKNALFQERLSHEQYSLDSHALLLQGSLLSEDQKMSLYQELKKHPLWNQCEIPGVPIFPHYPSNEVSPSVKVVGLRHYHDGFHWGWLVAEAAKIAKLMKDAKEANRIIESFHRSTRSQEFLAEIYEQKGGALTPVKRWLYQSEAPFSWSAGKWLELLND